MPKGCATCDPIAKASLIAGLILVAGGWVCDYLQIWEQFVELALQIGPLAWLLGMVEGIRGWRAERGRVIGAIALLNGVLFAAAVVFLYQ